MTETRDALDPPALKVTRVENSLVLRTAILSPVHTLNLDTRCLLAAPISYRYMTALDHACFASATYSREHGVGLILYCPRANPRLGEALGIQWSGVARLRTDKKRHG